MARDFAGAAFGEQLRRERERRGLGVDAICAATKVPVRHIVALESGAFADLPGGVFRRGFLRSYLSALELDEGSWMARFEESCRNSGVADSSDNGWTTFAENVKNSRSKPRRRNRYAWIWGWVVLGLLVAGISAGAVFLMRRNHARPHLPGAPKSWVGRLTSR